jgi:excisionase family DNA binding protein
VTLFTLTVTPVPTKKNPKKEKKAVDTVTRSDNLRLIAHKCLSLCAIRRKLIHEGAGGPMKIKLLTVNEVMQILSVSRRTIYYWIQNGTLKTVRIGNVYRFHPEDIDAVIQQNRSGKEVRPKRILAIDDDILVRESLAAILKRVNIEATIVSSGQEALDVLGKEVFDLVLTDIRMPKMNGIETLKAIRLQRSLAGKSPLPEVVLTAYQDPEIKRQADELGVREFLLKPFELDSFISALRTHLN